MLIPGFQDSKGILWFLPREWRYLIALWNAEKVSWRSDAMGCQSTFSCLWTVSEMNFTGRDREVQAGWMRTCATCTFTICFQMLMTLVPSPPSFLCLQQVCAISFALFNWKCIIKLVSVFHMLFSHTQNLQTGTLDFCLVSLYVSCENFEDAATKLWPSTWRAVKNRVGHVCQFGYCQLHCWTSTKPCASQTRQTSSKHSPPLWSPPVLGWLQKQGFCLNNQSKNKSIQGYT